MAWGCCEDRVLDGPASGGKGSNGPHSCSQDKASDSTFHAVSTFQDPPPAPRGVVEGAWGVDPLLLETGARGGILIPRIATW